MSDTTNAVILGGTGMRLLLSLEDTIHLLEAYVNARDMMGKDQTWLFAQKRFVEQLREANPKGE